MPTSQREMTVGELVDGDDLDFLKAMAVKRGISVPELIKEGIQEVIARRTKPKRMKGTVQALGAGRKAR